MGKRITIDFHNPMLYIMFVIGGLFLLFPAIFIIILLFAFVFFVLWLGDKRKQSQ